MSRKKNTSYQGQKMASPSQSRQPLLVRAVSGFVRYIINSATYSLRIFLRIGLGERSLDIVTVLLSFVWVCYFLTENFTFDFSLPDYVYDYELQIGREIPNFLKPFIIIISVIAQILTKAFGAFSNAGAMLGIVEPRYSPLEMSSLIYWYSLILLFFGIVHLIQIQLRATSKVHIHSYSHGKSILFWWVEGLKFPWIRGNKQTGRLTFKMIPIAKKTIFTYIEPSFIILIGVIAKNWYGHHQFGWFLIISALVLFWEERRESSSFRGQVLDMMDGELDGQALLEEYKKMKGEAVQGGNFERGARIPV